MPETDAERRTRQAAIEQAARARLHGVEMPKRLDFSAKKLHHEYLCFKTLAKKGVRMLRRARGQCKSKQSANVDGTRGMCQT